MTISAKANTMPTFAPQNIASEFPDYPIASLPNLDDWADVSWHNDVCPSFKRGSLLVWVDYPDPRDREDFEGCRFILCHLDKDGCLTGDDPVLETNDWEYVLGFLADQENEGDPLGNHHGHNY